MTVNRWVIRRESDGAYWYEHTGGFYPDLNYMATHETENDCGEWDDSVVCIPVRVTIEEEGTPSPVEALVKAAMLRIIKGHNDTCQSQLGDYPCNCGQKELCNALAAIEQEGSKP